MTVYLVISLPKIPYIHRIYMVLANPIYIPYERHLLLCVLLLGRVCTNKLRTKGKHTDAGVKIQTTRAISKKQQWQ